MHVWGMFALGNAQNGDLLRWVCIQRQNPNLKAWPRLDARRDRTGQLSFHFDTFGIEAAELSGLIAFAFDSEDDDSADAVRECGDRLGPILLWGNSGLVINHLAFALAGCD